jgi:hypothetical protein
MASWLGSVGVAGSLRDMFSALFLQNIVVADVGIGFVVEDIDVEVAASASALLAAAAAVEAAAAALVVCALLAVGSAAAAAAVGDIGAAAGVGAAAVPAVAVGAACAAGAPVVAAAVGVAAAADGGPVAADTAVAAVAVVPAVAPAVALAEAAPAEVAPAEAGAGAVAAVQVALVAVATMVFAALIPYPMGACMLSVQRDPFPISLGNLCMLWMMACVGVMMRYYRPIGHPLLQCLLAYLHPMNILWVRSSALKPCKRKGYVCAVCVPSSNPLFPTDWDAFAYMCP